MGGKSDVPLLQDGKRVDGRTPEEFRPVKVVAGVLETADGSAYVELGDTHAIAGVFGPRELHPRHQKLSARCRLKVNYSMAPFSVTDRKRPGPGRREKELSKVIAEAFEPVVLLKRFPATSIDVFVQVLQADAGTRVAAINAVSVALADAGIPMTDLVAACASGKAEGVVMADICGVEDNFGEADVPVAYAPRTGEITLLQMDGLLTDEEFSKTIDLNIKGCEMIYEAQKKALKTKFKGGSQ